jgi:hypothetical protein
MSPFGPLTLLRIEARRGWACALIAMEAVFGEQTLLVDNLGVDHL